MLTSPPEVDGELVSAWRKAASDLGVRLVAPHLLQDGKGGEIWVEGFLPDFGGNAGMIFTGLSRSVPPTDLYVSMISATYREYDRATFIEAMSDWGWYGPIAERPEWLPFRPSSD